MKDFISERVHKIANKFQTSMESGVDKLEAKIDKLDDKLDTFSTSKLDTGTFWKVTSIIVAVILSFGGLFLKLSLDINSIKTVLQVAEITHD